MKVYITLTDEWPLLKKQKKIRFMKSDRYDSTNLIWINNIQIKL